MKKKKKKTDDVEMEKLAHLCGALTIRISNAHRRRRVLCDTVESFKEEVQQIFEGFAAAIESADKRLRDAIDETETIYEIIGKMALGETLTEVDEINIAILSDHETHLDED